MMSYEWHFLYIYGPKYVGSYVGYVMSKKLSGKYT